MQLIAGVFAADSPNDVLAVICKTNLFFRLLERLQHLERHRHTLRRDVSEASLLAVKRLLTCLKDKLRARPDMRSLYDSLTAMQANSSFLELIGDKFFAAD